jgi:hypothetical protein
MLAASGCEHRCIFDTAFGEMDFSSKPVAGDKLQDDRKCQ